MLTSTGPPLAAVQQHDRVGALADVAAGGQLLLLVGGQAGAAVRADDQPVRAGPGARALGGQGVDAVERGVDLDAEADDRQQQHEQQHTELAAPAPAAPRSADGGWAARRLDGRAVGNALTRRLGRRHHRGRPGRVRPGGGGGAAPRRTGRVGPGGQDGGSGAAGRCCGAGPPGPAPRPGGPRGPPRSSPPMSRTTLHPSDRGLRLDLHDTQAGDGAAGVPAPVRPRVGTEWRANVAVGALVQCPNSYIRSPIRADSR